MSELVVDASVAGGWFIGDEASAYSDAVLTIVATSGAMVPSLWPYEIANMLTILERRGRATPDEVSQALHLLAALRMEIDPSPTVGTLPVLTSVARDHELTAYDAAYLELAIRRRAVLATRDARLERAAAGAGVELFSA